MFTQFSVILFAFVFKRHLVISPSRFELGGGEADARFCALHCELFLNNVRKDILEPRNLRKPKDNLTREERLALRNLKHSDNIIRIQDKRSRFVILNREE